MGDRELLAAADLACQREVWDRCINTSERTKVEMDFSQRFPMPHKAAVLQRTSQIGLDPAYVYGLIRQESRFIMDARSGVGAAGLMQVMPPTASWTAKKIGLTDFKPHQITDRDTNIAIGTGYLKLVLDDFAGSMPMAAAAYNAGPSRPRAWRGQAGAPVLEAAIWAENVPFNETRDYVKKVLSNTTNYAALISGQPQSLKNRLGLVGPKSANAATPDANLP
jgi:soluble lytic murein transglycosylase